MRKEIKCGMLIAGICAGAVNGLFGAGGGMVLVPLFTLLTGLTDEEIFPSSLSVILPVTLISLAFTAGTTGIPVTRAIPYLAGGAAGGLLAGWLGSKIPVLWLHRGLGMLILYGGYRYLWQTP